MEAFLRDLSDESITSKSELLTLAFPLGLKNPHQTVERLVRDHPRDIRQATWKFFCLWNNVDSSEHKLEKLKTAYSLMNKEGLYQKVTRRHNLITQPQRQIVLAEPYSNSSTTTAEISFSPDRTNTFLVEICKNIATVSDLQTVAISCGCYPEVEAATSNWPTDILQAAFDVILRWWFGSSEDEERKISRLEEGFREMKKPVVFNKIASITGMTVGQGGQGQQRQVEYQRENRQNPQEEFHQNMQSDYGIQPRFPERQGAHYVGNIGQRIAVGDQRTNTTLAWPGDDMDTSDITSSGATGFDYNAHQSVSASVPVNPPGGPDLQNRNRQDNLLDLHNCDGVHTDLKTSTIQNASSVPCQQLTQYPYDKKVAKVFIVNNICGELKQTESGYPGKPEMDTNQLKTDFVDIGCDVSYHKDLHGDDMRGLRGDIQRYSFNNYNMFFCVIVCHGDVAGTLLDAKKDVGVPFNDLVKSAAENLTLRGKPKIFFLCACRGTENNSGIFSLHKDNFGTHHIPEFADVAIAYPTQEGHEYQLNTKPGDSNPIEALCQSLRIDRIPRPRTLHKILLNWTNILTQTTYIARNGDIVKQTPGVYTSLRDEVYC